MRKLKYMLAGLVIGLTSMSVQAQEKMTSEERASKQTEHMATELSLSPEQKEKVAAINLGIVQKNDAIRLDQTMTPDFKKNAIMQNNEARKELFKSILTPEQFTKMEQMEEDRKSKMKDVKRMEKPANRTIEKQ